MTCFGNPATLITGTVGLTELRAAFEALARPDAYAKIIIDPGSTEAGLGGDVDPG